MMVLRTARVIGRPVCMDDAKGIFEAHAEGKLRRYLVHPNIEDAPRDCACHDATW